MSTHSTYEFLRHLADSWFLLVIMTVFVTLALWPFRPGARRRNEEASNVIFKDDGDDE